jgi:hypothetical protein
MHATKDASPDAPILIGVESSPGSGKTHIAKNVYALFGSKQAVFSAFNVDAKDEALRRGMPNSHTQNAVGQGICKKYILQPIYAHQTKMKIPSDDRVKQLELMSNKTLAVFLNLLPPDDGRGEVFGLFIQELRSRAMHACFGLSGFSPMTDDSALMELVAHYELDDKLRDHLSSPMVSDVNRAAAMQHWPSIDLMVQHAIGLMQHVHITCITLCTSTSWAPRGETVTTVYSGNKEITLPLLDFDEQIYVPLLRNWPWFSRYYRVVLIDEAQDLSRLRVHCALAMWRSANAKRLHRPVPKLVLFGDTDQAVNLWANALENAMAAMNAIFRNNGYNVATFTLSMCFRCPTSQPRRC